LDETQTPAFLDLISALRFTGHEVQLGRVLHSLSRDPAVADAFVAAVLRSRKRPPGALSAELAVPAGLTCIDEDKLFTIDTAIRSRHRQEEL
jgi:hypothetical protein